MSPVGRRGGLASLRGGTHWPERGSVLQCVHGRCPGTSYYNVPYNDDWQSDLARKEAPLDEFHRDLLFLLHDVARLLRVDADKRARQHSMTRAQWGILIWLRRQPGISQKELAELLEVEPITVARLIDRLEARGMVERRPDPRDRRIWRLHLLPPAWAMLDDIYDQRADLMRVLTTGVDRQSLHTMTEALLRMKANLTHEAQAARRGAEVAEAATGEAV